MQNYSKSLQVVRHYYGDAHLKIAINYENLGETYR
jgi:hypothetical protein